ncbi:DoxX family protein [Flavobacterium sp. TSSA_36]|uniref:DoxX family protein n=1 Tax=Flavobacterium sp. TSSA_36 TaxID=3447669 RepID=UPI003F349DE2
MNVYKICIFLSSISFFGYVISYFTSPHMKGEFKRFGLEKLGLLTIILQCIGAAGLLIGLYYQPLLLLSSLGLGTLMLLGLLVRIRLKDSLWISIPALFYMFLNFYIFWETLKK